MIQPNFQACPSVEEFSSKPSHEYLTWYHFLMCADTKRDVWEDPKLAELSKVERMNASKRPTTTGGGMYKLAF